jgi:hypothetical protein
VIDTFYAINRRLADPTTRDDTLVAIGEVQPPRPRFDAESRAATKFTAHRRKRLT